MYENRTFYIAGGRTGFLGVNVVKYLLKHNARVYAHGLNHAKRSFHTPQNKLVEMTGDLSKPSMIPIGTDCVVNCAAHTSGAKEMQINPSAQIDTNIFINTNILDAALKAGVKQYIFISSSAIYPELDRPLREDDGFIGDPPGNYFGPGWMKRYSEKLAEFYHKWHGMQVLVIRPSNIYGPYSSFDLEYSHVLPALIRKFVERHNPLEVWGTPLVVRDFIYIDDFVEGVFMAYNNMTSFHVLNIASGVLHTIGEAVSAIKEITEYPYEVTYNASKPMTVKSRKIDPSKANKELGFTARTSFKDGLRKTIEWYRSTLSGR